MDCKDLPLNSYFQPWPNVPAWSDHCMKAFEGQGLSSKNGKIASHPKDGFSPEKLEKIYREREIPFKNWCPTEWDVS